MTPSRQLCFRWSLTAARISSLLGRRDDARELAEIALRCPDRNEAPSSRHPDVGLIEPDEGALRELEALAQANPK